MFTEEIMLSNTKELLKKHEVCLVEKYYKQDNYNILDHEINYVFV